MSNCSIKETLFSEEQISSRVSEIAADISRDYEGRGCLLIGILKGAFIFMADLARRITVPVEVDFMALSSYGSATKTSGIVRILKDLDLDITGRHVIIVEDIVDTGLTLNYLISSLSARGPASICICTLLNKETGRKVELPLKYEGFSVPDIFVVGYGLDCAQEFRNLPFIASVSR